ncbi:DUF983 domain-containing protein [Rubellicoccus peritrichatus]|uniref:DUF983 domain-containing protein n=1 Tax=Rubellicoccus peritrichatus TaxID=3080537 RepID=A0AAQ3LA35_9BACT|nr:DUF983 domain-containing protein [Puniceicoccus sp. CR14]WOO40150.1 DUF983 domain-containing protein [Puniceicoccus sp. CR14]
MPSNDSADVSREEIIARSLTGRCPNCGCFGLFKSWFKLNKTCRDCGMSLEKEESGFYFGTTSIGYVVSIIVVLIPICLLVVNKALSVWTGVALAILGSVLLTMLIYPLMLSWIIMSYYVLFPNQLPRNGSTKPNDAQSE